MKYINLVTSSKKRKIFSQSSEINRPLNLFLFLYTLRACAWFSNILLTFATVFENKKEHVILNDSERYSVIKQAFYGEYFMEFVIWSQNLRKYLKIFRSVLVSKCHLSQFRFWLMNYSLLRSGQANWTLLNVHAYIHVCYIKQSSEQILKILLIK